MRIRLICICSLLAIGLCAQTVTSTLVGRVKDASGLPVQGAVVEVVNAGTGITAHAKTDSKGTYSVPSLLAGVYNVSVRKNGFADYRATGLRIYTAQRVRIDATLQLAQSSQTVTVRVQAPLVHTDSPTISSSVSQQQLSELPNSLQTVDSMLSLAAGTQVTTGSEASNPPVGGGSHWGSVNYTVNGSSVNDPGNSGAATVQGKGLLVLPPPSSLQELHVDANGASAEYRDHASVMLVTKAGTNKFHGQLYELNQNSALGANDFLLNAKGVARPFLNINQFGGNLGGPIVHNRAFFFFDYSGYRERQSKVVQTNLPSMAMRKGDFSALCSAYDSNGVCAKGKGVQLYNPWTGTAFANNQIPGNLIASQATQLLSYLPAPTDTASPGLPNESPNYLGIIPLVRNSNAIDLRIDDQVTANDSLFSTFSQRIANPWDSSGGRAPNYGNGRYNYKDKTLSLDETHVFGPSMINTFKASWGDYYTLFGGQNLDLNPQSLFPQMAQSWPMGLPTIGITGYSGLWHDVGTAMGTPRFSLEFTDDVTWVHGSHTVKMGADEMGWRVSSRVPSAGNPTGAFNFNGHWTGNLGQPGQPTSGGNAFADFLLGAPSSDQTNATGRFADWLYSRDWSFYVQDTWQVFPELTLYYGLRYEYQSPWHYKYPMETTFDFNNGKLVLPENSQTPQLPDGALQYMFDAYPFETTASIGLPINYIQGDKNDWAPRLGFAYRPFGGTSTVIRGGYGVYYNFQPAFVGSRAEAWNPPWDLSVTQPFVSGLPGKPKSPYTPDLTFSDPFPTAKGKQTVSPNPTIDVYQHDFRHALMQEWTLTVEQQFATNWAVRASYVGNQTRNLPYNFGDVNRPLVQQPNVPEQNQRPYQPWGSVQYTRSTGIANFNQLQLGVQHRFSSGFMAQVNYQYSRSLDDVPQSGSPQIWQLPMLDYGNSQGIRRHWLTANYVYQIPFGKGRRWNATGLMDEVLGGWQLSGIGQYGTGIPFSVNFSQAGTKYIGWWGGRADKVAGVSPNVGNPSGSHDIVNGVQWFDPGAFAAPQPWTWGNSSRDMLFGPGMWNWDMSVMKNVHVGERYNLRLQADFLNAFNHFNLGNPVGTVADTRDGGNAVANAGKIIGGSGTRTIQLGVHLRW